MKIQLTVHDALAVELQDIADVLEQPVSETILQYAMQALIEAALGTDQWDVAERLLRAYVQHGVPDHLRPLFAVYGMAPARQ